jgi:hypothetical protein
MLKASVVPYGQSRHFTAAHRRPSEEQSALALSKISLQRRRGIGQIPRRMPHEPSDVPGKGADRQPPARSSRLLRAIAETLRCEVPRRDQARGAEAEREIALEVDEVLADQQRAAALLSALFPGGTPTNVEFYQRLNDFHLRLGWNETANRLAGSMLALTITQVTKGDGEALLAALPQVTSPGFFQSLYYLATLLREQEFRPEFVAGWFAALVKRIGNDLASGGFWKSLEDFCVQHPANALDTLRCLLPPSDEEQVSVAACILGTLRSLELGLELHSSFTAIESEFRDAVAPGARGVYNRSWIQTACRGKLEVTALEGVVLRMSSGTAEERDQVFWILSKSLLAPSVPPSCFEFGLKWLRMATSSSIPPVAKYHVVEFASLLRPDLVKDASALILAVQPVPPDHKGIWQRTEQYLVTLLERDLGAFNEFLVKLGRANPANWLKLLQPAREFEWLRSVMRGKDVGSAVAELLLDDESECRKLGLFFFDDLGLTNLPQELLDAVGERRIALAFYELQRTSVHATASARLLILLIPSMRRAEEALRREFEDELVLNLKNYPRACREEYERRSKEFPILQDAIAQADHYFEQLKQVRESGVVGMEVAGHRQASGLYARRFAREVSKGAEEMSVFMKMFKRVRLLYGKQWSTFHDGVLSESSGLHQISSSMDVPRMEFINPEEMFLRRMHASAKILELTGKAAAPKTN